MKSRQYRRDADEKRRTDRNYAPRVNRVNPPVKRPSHTGRLPTIADRPAPEIGGRRRMRRTDAEWGHGSRFLSEHLNGGLSHVVVFGEDLLVEPPLVQPVIAFVAHEYAEPGGLNERSGREFGRQVRWFATVPLPRGDNHPGSAPFGRRRTGHRRTAQNRPRGRTPGELMCAAITPSESDARLRQGTRVAGETDGGERSGCRSTARGGTRLASVARGIAAIVPLAHRTLLTYNFLYVAAG
jgi:hypothetical protein